MTTAKTLVLGLGNPILGDDGVGWHIAEQVRQHLDSPAKPRHRRWDEVEVDCLARGGLSLMERMIGYERVILLDAITLGQGPPGSVYRFRLEELPDPSLRSGPIGHLSSAHDTSLQTALHLGRTMGVALPEQVTVVAVEAQSVYDFAEELTPPIAAAVPRAVQVVMEALEETCQASDRLAGPAGE